MNQDIKIRDFDNAYLQFDKNLIRRTKNLRLVPGLDERRGGKISYGEWCHVIGIFQTLLFLHLKRKTNNRILDIGCGTGLMGIAAEPFLGGSGQYTGIDVSTEDISFCVQNYPPDSYSFKHHDVHNATYASGQVDGNIPWDIDDNSIDMLTALSVWTHLNESDARYYFSEIGRVLKSGAKAMVTFFLMDDTYCLRPDAQTDTKGRYHNTSRQKWIFDTPCSESGNWFHPKWAKRPEDAIGITEEGLNSLMAGTGLSLAASYPGNWKEVPGIFFQDVLIFQKD
ncbi:MAG: class I SAM-dependent methyltransferase [Desulfobacterales bacterium]|nr:class I SAM-dependent methyltransferase [Desulfobacterales bacterium]